VPDVQVLAWLPAALLVVRRLLSREAVDCLITSGPPDSNHLIGLLLGSRRPPWIADFRDGWCFEPLRQPFPTPAQRFLDAWVEHRVAREADIAVGATRPIAEDLERRLDAHAAYVPSGWDPEEAPQTLTSSERARADDTRRDGDKPVSLVYTGTFSGVRGSNPGPLLRALHLVRAIPGVPPVRLTLAGRLTNDERILIERSGVMDVVDHVGLLTRGAALALQRSADALVLLTSRSRSEATGKLFEYLGAGRPIIALAEGNEAERIVRETNTGVTVPPDDVDAIVRALRRVASGELEKEYAPRNLERYTYPGPAEAMAELIETAIRLRAQS
jgi:glycosyltransferase involved in cell wall biosynthesis